MTAPPDMKWGISTLGCHELDLTAVCQLAATHRVRHLEIRSLADCLRLPEYLDANYPADAASVQKTLDQYRQSIIALNSGFSLISAGDKDRDELLEFARWADLLGVPFVRVFGGGDMNTPLSQSDLQTAVHHLQWWKRQREQNNWRTQIALETHGGFSSGKRCCQLAEAFGSPTEIIWDTHHTWKLGQESFQQTWDQLGPMVRHVHVKDSVSVPSARHPYSDVLPGKGEFPFFEACTVLHENNYDGVVSLEWERKWHPYLSDLETALVALDDSGWRRRSPHSPVDDAAVLQGVNLST